MKVLADFLTGHMERLFKYKGEWSFVKVVIGIAVIEVIVLWGMFLYLF